MNPSSAYQKGIHLTVEINNDIVTTFSAIKATLISLGLFFSVALFVGIVIFSLNLNCRKDKRYNNGRYTGFYLILFHICRSYNKRTESLLFFHRLAGAACSIWIGTTRVTLRQFHMPLHFLLECQ